MIKKILLTTLFIFFSLQLNITFAKTTNNAKNIEEKEIIDELVQGKTFNKNTEKIQKNNSLIEDELVSSNEVIGSKLNIRIMMNKIIKEEIQDELIDSHFISKNLSNSKYKNNIKNSIEDEFAKKVIDKTKLTIIKTKNKYNFAKKQIPIKLQIAKKFNAKDGVKEGNFLEFKTISDAIINNIKLPKGTSVIGRIETVSKSDKMGVPESIVIDNFYVKQKPEINFYGYISKSGANRTIWVYPLYQAGNILLYVAGFVFVPIHGGHVKFSTDEIYTVYYETYQPI